MSALGGMSALCQNRTHAVQQRREQAKRPAVQGIQGYFSRCSAWAARYRLVPAGQMGQLGFYFNVREAATDIDGD